MGGGGEAEVVFEEPGDLGLVMEIVGWIGIKMIAGWVFGVEGEEEEGRRSGEVKVTEEMIGAMMGNGERKR